jgi:hypothetical protein
MGLRRGGRAGVSVSRRYRALGVLVLASDGAGARVRPPRRRGLGGLVRPGSKTPGFGAAFKWHLRRNVTCDPAKFGEAAPGSDGA